MAGNAANFSLLSSLLERLTNVESQMKSVTKEVIDIKTQLRDFCSTTAVDGVRVKRELDSDESDECVKRARMEFQKEDGYVVVYTDGACTNNGYKGAKAGVGIWFGPDHPLNLAKPVVGKATNNVAELQACICAIRIALENGVDKLKIKTDSMLIVNSMTKWIHNWKKNNWMSAGGGPVKNQNELRELDKLTNKLQAIQWVHVKGHNGLAGNDSADALAQLGASFYPKKKLS